jgi:hypothetical protein
MGERIKGFWGALRVITGFSFITDTHDFFPDKDFFAVT